MSFLDNLSDTYQKLAGPQLAALALGSGLLAGGYTFASRNTPSSDEDQAVMPVMTPKRLRSYMESLDKDRAQSVPDDIQESADKALQQIEDGEVPDLNKEADLGLADYLSDPDNLGTVMGIAAAASTVPVGLYGGSEIAERMMVNSQGKDLRQARRDFNKAMLEEQLAAIESGRHGEIRPVKSGQEGEEDSGGLWSTIKSAPSILMLSSLLAGGVGGYAYQSMNSSAWKEHAELKRIMNNRMADRSTMTHEFHPDDLPDYNREAIKDFASYLEDKRSTGE